MKHGGVNATVPRDVRPEDVSVEQAVALLAERAAKGGGKARAARPKKAAAPRPVAANDSAPKRAATKKATPKKAVKKLKNESPPRTGTDG